MDRVLLTGAGTIVILTCFAGAFIGLTSNSLWLDEMFTAYMTDPAQSSLKAVVLRLSEAVHPPGYYSLLWSVQQVWPGDFVVVSRTLSAVLGCLAVLALILAPARDLPLPPRLLAAAFAAGTQLWFYMTQEARSYALIFLLLSCLLAAALRCQARLAKGEIPWLPLGLMGLVAVLASLTHYYAFLVSGAAFAMLLVYCRSWPARFSVAAVGLAVAALVGAYVVWHLSRIVAIGENNWYEISPEFLLLQLSQGFRTLLQSGTNKLFVAVVLLLVVLAALVRGPRRFWQDRVQDRTVAALALLGGIFLLSILLGIAVTLTVTPMLSFRLFIVLAPVFWIAMAYVLAAVLKGVDGWRWALLVPVVLALVTLPLAKKVTHRGQDGKQAWRHSAERVEALPGCAAAELPVLWFDWAFTEDPMPRFYGFYLAPDPDRTWLTISRNDPLAALASEEMAALVAETVSGARECPLLLWSVHFMLYDNRIPIHQAIEAHIPEGSGKRLRREEIRPEHGHLGHQAYLYILE